MNLLEDKTFDLMSKMYTEMNLKFDEINIKLDKKADKSDIIRLEDKFEDKTKSLFDGYTQTYEKLTNIEKKLEAISIKVEKQDIEIRVIKNIAN
ncbi:hypothetical protein [Clostridium sp.]|uniref:hypothetical protein n=1 Tax=Clostridium sp. TaxID=1506 RepID=UPI003D6D8F37